MNFGLSGAVVDVLGSNSETPLYLNRQNSVNTIFVEELAYRGLPALPNRHVVAFTLVTLDSLRERKLESVRADQRSTDR